MFQQADHPEIGYGAIGKSDNDDDEEQFRAYPQRWLVLAAFSFLAFMNNWIWITWSPIALEIAKYWAVPVSSVDSLSSVYMYLYIPISFPALIALHRYKLKWGLLVGGGLNFAGSVVRLIGLDSYQWVYVGTLLCAGCETLSLAMPPLISTLWFQEQERGLATSLAVLASQLGIAVGLGVTILVDFSPLNHEEENINKTKLNLYLGFQMILSGMSLALIVFGVRTHVPRTPPSKAAMSQKQTTYAESIGLLLVQTSGSVLCVVYGLGIGVLGSVATFMSQYFSCDECDWSQKEAGYLGLVLILSGLPGLLLSGEYLDKTRAYRRITVALLLLSLVSMLGFLLLLEYVPSNRGLAYMTISSLGFSLVGFISVGFEYGTAISYPADESACAGIMNVAANLSGWVLVSTGGYLGAKQSFNVILVGALLVALCLMTFVRSASVRPGEH